MSGYPRLAECVRGVLKTKARAGSTTKSEATILVMNKIDKVGGPTKFGIGAAALRLALANIVNTEVSRQFKSSISEHAQTFILPKDETDILSQFERIPGWIAIEEGADALWVFSLKARPEHWMANAQMKEKKALQTIERANFSMEVAMYLETHGFKSLEDVLAKE